MKKGEKGGLYKELEMKIGEKRSVELSEYVKGRQLCCLLTGGICTRSGSGERRRLWGDPRLKKNGSCNSVMGIYIV